ncbi:MAG: outer membrane protein assembly factor BamD [bacterium]|nr:outer membrane protein assembly factor BamD [bacterium]
MKTKFLTITAAVALISLSVVLLTSCGGSNSLADRSSRELFDMGMEQYSKKKYFKAIDLFQAVIYNYPGVELIDTAQYYLGLSYFGNKDFPLAAVEFNRLALNYPSSDFFDDAVFLRGVSYYESTPDHYGLDQSDLYQAIQHLSDFIIDFPESDRIEDAEAILAKAKGKLARKYYEGGTVYSRIGGYKAAKIYFQKVIDDYTDSEYAPLATYYSAEMDFKSKNYAEARDGFEKFLLVFKDHELADKGAKKLIESAFLAGETAFESGDYPEARKYLEQFKTDFPDDKRVKKVNEYLDEIPTDHADTVEVSNAGS